MQANCTEVIQVNTDNISYRYYSPLSQVEHHSLIKKQVISQDTVPI